MDSKIELHKQSLFEAYFQMYKNDPRAIVKWALLIKIQKLFSLNLRDTSGRFRQRY